MGLTEPAIDWATNHGPPNWVFLVAVLTRPSVWAKHLKTVVREQYDRLNAT